MVVAVPGRPVAAAAGGKGGVVEAVHGVPIGRLERDVHARRRLPVVADVELVRRERALALAGEPEPERLERGPVEALRSLEVADAEVHVVEQPALMELHRRQPRSRVASASWKGAQLTTRYLR